MSVPGPKLGLDGGARELLNRSAQMVATYLLCSCYMSDEDGNVIDDGVEREEVQMDGGVDGAQI